MADKAEKPKKPKAKAKKDEQGVLAALPSTRPERIGTRRASAPKTFVESEAADAAATPAEAKPATSTAKAASRAKSSTAKPSTRAKSSAAKPAARAQTSTAKPSARPQSPAANPAASSESATRAVSEPRPRPVREGAPGMGTSGAREQPSAERGRPGRAELASTAVRAAGEITKLGFSMGRRIINRAVPRRLKR